ncbi:MAG: hypothetical protein H6711_12640 [Myxococcales bacterium]|nr:hypothetical protein [Myxococcales bacterium]
MTASPLAFALALALTHAPVAVSPSASPPPDPSAAASEPAPTYGRAEADADLDTLLVARGREYLDARARLEENPVIVAPLVAARLAATSPPLGPAERQRLIVLLGAFGRPEDLRVFADQLRREVAGASPGNELAAAEPWRILLREQGPAAATTLIELVGDRSLGEGLRAVLLADLLAILPPDRLPEFVAMVGVGQETLRQALRQGLARRARQSPGDRQGLLDAVDRAIEGAQPSQQAALLGLRASLSEGADAGFHGRLIALAEADQSPFVVRVAAIRILAGHVDAAEIQGALLRLAATHLTPTARRVQASEILGWLALRALPPALVRELATTLDLRGDDSPRLAAAAYDVAALADDGAWLAEGLAHPWPEVQVAALARVAAPCPRDVVRRLAGVAAMPEKGGTDDLLVAREAIRALGRCGAGDPESALIKLLGNNRVEGQRRGEAARQLLVIGAPRGIAAVAKALETAGDPEVVRRLVDAVRAAGGAPPEPVIVGLCQVAVDLPALRAPVADTLRQVAPGRTCSIDQGE